MKKPNREERLLSALVLANKEIEKYEFMGAFFSGKASARYRCLQCWSRISSDGRGCHICYYDDHNKKS